MCVEILEKYKIYVCIQYFWCSQDEDEKAIQSK